MTTNDQSNSLSIGMAFIAGIGLTLMVVAAGVGVVQGEAASSSLLGLMFAGGLVMLISGIVAWFVIVQPHHHFDDINVPEYTGHGHGDEHHAEEHAIVEHH